MDALHESDRNRTSYLQENSLIRLVSAAASVSLVAAAGVILVEAHAHQRPLLQVPAILLTLGLGGLVLYASSFAVEGRRAVAQVLWGTGIAGCVLLPFLQALPTDYNTLILLDIMALGPPLWPYAVAIPLLLFLLLEASLPRRGSNSTSYLFLSIGLLSAIMLLFFATTLVGEVANQSILVAVPRYLFLSLLAPIGLSSLIVLAVVLNRKGMAAVGIALLLVAGLGIEWMSTWSYAGPHFLEPRIRFQAANYPLLPVLAGTIPGILAAAAGILAGWEVYVRDGGRDEDDPIADVVPQIEGNPS